MPETPSPDAPAVPAHAQAGDRIADRYELVRLVASGGMAEVWEARDEVLGRPVAVKLLHRHLSADPAFTQRFRTEAVAAARLHHPSIVAIYDTCRDQGREAIVMELVRGRTLREYLDERHRLDADEVVQIGADVSAALAVAHRAGIIHRDIKPANILLCDDARVMVTDFGIAKVRDDTDLTNTGTMLGTVKYLSPEQVESSPVDERTDVYALGVVLYECLAGRAPFTGDTAAATALARLHRTPPPPRALRHDVPAGLDAAVMRAMAREPDHRFRTVTDLRTALLAADPSPGTSPPVGTDATVIARAPAADPTDWGPPPPRPPAAAIPLVTGSDPVPPPAPAPVPERPARGSARSGWLGPGLLALLIGASIGLALALVARTGPGDEQGAPPPGAGAAAASVSATAFDPFGSDGEHDDEASLAVDGDPATGWRTETYNQREFGGGKAGVGLVASLDRATELDRLRVESPTRGWSAQIYVSDGRPAALAGWGEPVASADTIDGDAVFDLDGTEGRHVLLWITRLGEPPHRVEIDEVSVQTR